MDTDRSGGVRQEEVRMPGLPGDNAIVTTMLVPTKTLAEPSMDKDGNLPGKHSLLSFIDFDDAETPTCSKKDDQEAKIQVLHQQPPSLVVDDRSQEDTPDPEQSTIPRDEDDQGDRPEDNKVKDDDVQYNNNNRFIFLVISDKVYRHQNSTKYILF